MCIVEIDLAAGCAREPELLAGSHLDLPKLGTTSDFYGIRVMGWALGLDSPVVAVEFVEGSHVIHRTGMNLPRPDVAAHLPDHPGAASCGFSTVAGLLWVPVDFKISVQAIFPDGRREEFGRISGRRRPVRGSSPPRLQPLMITTLGRTGSTWVTHLLSQHPQIAAYRPFLFEPHVLSYWVEILRRIAAPGSALQSVFGADFVRREWWLAPDPGALPDLGSLDPEIQECLGRASVQALADLCLARIDDFYTRAGRIQGKDAPAFFAEKQMPAASRDIALELYPGAKEIILVRDPRDMTASIFAFNAKRNYAAFGRERFGTDEEYIAGGLRPDALDLLGAWKRRGKQAFLLRYEDTITRPEQTLAAVLTYLGLDAGAATIARMIEQARAHIPEAVQHRTTSDPALSIGRWRTDLSHVQRAACAQAFGEVLREFGYEADENALAALEGVTAP